MVSTSHQSHIRDRIFSLLDFVYDGQIQCVSSDDITVDYEDGVLTVGCDSPSHFARALFLFAKEHRAGRDTIHIRQTPRFRELSVMLSVTTTMKVESVISYMEYMAALGFNQLHLYMETNYEVKEYPFFGYLTGRYTPDDLKRIDDAGYMLGIEVIPCVQTFGHLQNYLVWGAAGEIKDSATVVLVGEEKTYTFIDALLRALRPCFRTNKIHIGMDETRGLGLGNYLRNHPYTNPGDLFYQHLNRVKNMCKEYGYEPQIWSDMIFRLAGDRFGGDYDTSVTLPESLRDLTDGVRLCFWDYYRYNYDFYDTCMKMHKENSNLPVMFCGGVWVLDQYLINMPHTLRATIPAMKAALDNNLSCVMTTIWGSADNTNLEQSIWGLPAFSEYCYLGESCTEDDIYNANFALTGVSRAFIDAISELHLGYKNSLKLGARFICTDMLYGLIRFDADYDEAIARYRAAIDVISQETLPENAFISKEYALLVFRIAMTKCEILRDIRKKYAEKDTAFLDRVANVLIPELIPAYRQLRKMQEAFWLKSTRPFRMEGMQIEFAGMIARMEYAQETINRYLTGEQEKIYELEEEILDEGYIDWLSNMSHMRIP